MANVYSVRLWAVLSTTGPGAVLGPVVPAGFTWVVRDVRATNASQEASILGNLVLLVHAGPTIFATPQFSTIGGLFYEWQGHAIVNAGEQLELVVSEPGWTLDVDGYQLTLP